MTTEPTTSTAHCAACGRPVLTFTIRASESYVTGNVYCGDSECIAGRRAKAAS